MANQLRMADQKAIVALAGHGWSYRRIARELGIHRETAARYVHLARDGPESATPNAGPDSKPAISTPGDGEPKPAISTPGYPGRQSHCEPFRKVIVESLEQGLSAQRIWQDLRTEHSFGASYQSVKRFVRSLRSARPLPFRRMECGPGQEAQVDFGTGASVVRPDGKRKRPHVFRIVLSHSRKAYSEVVYRQRTEDFIRCLENSFWHFGGVPKTLVIDNLKAAVSRADWFDPDINPKVQAFCEHYGTVILPTKPYTPRHKGKVEKGVDYVQDNGLRGRTFTSLQDENRYLLDWEKSVADTRIHGTTRKQVGKVFEEVERPALQPLPAERFPFFHEAERSVHRDAHMEVDKAYYSVPPEYVWRRVWVRWDAHVVRIFDRQMRQIAIHVKHEPGRFSTQSPHIASAKRSGVERGSRWLLRKVSLIGPQTGRWAAAMLAQRGIQGVRVLVGLLSLAERHPCPSIEQACETARSHGAYRLRVIRELLRRQGPKQEEFEFVQEHPIIRSIADYGEVVRESFQRGQPHEMHGLVAPGDTSSAGFPRPLPWASFPSLMAGDRQ